MKILVAQIVGTGSFARGVMPDTLQNLIDQHPSAEIFHLTCSNSFNTCYVNQFSQPDICYRCKLGVKKSLKLVKGKFRHITIEKIIKREDQLQGELFLKKNLKIGKNTLYEKYRVGESSLSSYISLSRDKDLVNIKGSNFRHLVENGIILYSALDRFFKQENFNMVFSFNGRHTYHRAIMDISIKYGISCYNMEVARPGGFLEIFKNILPHNIENRKKIVEDEWERSTLPIEEKQKIGEGYFEGKLKGEKLNDTVYTKEQKANLLPANLDFDKEIDVLYTSSDDEFAAVGEEYNNPFFQNQNEGIKYLAQLYSEKFPEKQLIVRMHPNLKNLNYDYVIELKQIGQHYSNIEIIAPESPIDTYALLKLAGKVIVFGSTIGVEANFWRKPVILLGKSFYFNMNIAYIPDNLQDIKKLLSQDLAPKSIDDSLKFGFYYLKGGEKSKYFTSTKNRTVYFKGKVMYSFSFLERVISKTIQVVYRITGLRILVRR